MHSSIIFEYMQAAHAIRCRVRSFQFFRWNTTEGRKEGVNSSMELELELELEPKLD
jgi:hypothetical protein